MFLVFGWDSGVCGMVGWLDGGFVGWKRIKSREAGMWGQKPFREPANGDKAENSFSALSPLSPTVARFAPHSHPSPPEKKAASRRKSRLRRKKIACGGLRRVVAWGRWVAWLMLEWERWRDGGMALERADGIVGFVVIKFLNIDLRITVEIHKYAYRKLCAK